MASARQELPSDSPARQAVFDLPECLFAVIGLGLVVGLAVRDGLSIVTGVTAVLTTAYVLLVILSTVGSRPRWLLNYAAICAVYGGSTWLVEALRMPVRHDILLRWDRALFGETPCVLLGPRTAGWENDLLSAGYLSYHFYLHWILLDALFRSPRWRSRYGRVLGSTFAIGFLGYFAFSASGPEIAYPEFFPEPIAGGWLTQCNQALVRNLAARYDAFPSLHILVTAAMLACDWRWCRWRAGVMVLPSVIMVAATILLRLHYAVDLIASTILIGPVLFLVRPREVSDAH